MDILFAENSERKTVELKPETVKDLAIQEIVDSIAENETEMLIVRDIFTHIPTDTRDIRFRSEILQDFLNNEKLSEELTEALSYIRTLKNYGSSKLLQIEGDNTLYVMLEHLRELSVYVNASEAIVDCLKNNEIKSAGLKNVLSNMEKIVNDEKFEIAKTDINKMLEHMSNVRGAYVGVNFTPDLNVEMVTAVEFVP